MMASMHSFHWLLSSLLLCWLHVARLAKTDEGKSVGDCTTLLKGRSLRLAGLGLPPFLNVHESVNGIPSGVDTDILQVVAAKLSFSLSFKATKLYGLQLPNGTWLGTIGAVIKSNADIGIGQISLNAERLRAVDFTTPTNVATLSFLTRGPRPLTSHFKVLQPFPIEMWTLILLILVLITLLLGTEYGGEAPLISALVDVLGIMIAKRDAQGLRRKVIHRHTFTLLFIPFLLFSTLIIHAYNSTLLSHLLKVEYERPIRSGEDLLREQRQLYLMYGTNQHFVFSKAKRSSHQTLFEQCEEHRRFYNLQGGGVPMDITRRVIEHGAAIVLDQWETRELTEKVRAQLGYNPLRSAEEHVDFVSRGFVVKKGSVLKYCFDPLIRHLRDCGVVEKIFDLNASPFSNGQRSEEEEVNLKLEHLHFAFLLLVVGMLLASVTFICERLKGAQRRPVE